MVIRFVLPPLDAVDLVARELSGEGVNGGDEDLEVRGLRLVHVELERGEHTLGADLVIVELHLAQFLDVPDVRLQIYRMLG